MIRLQIIERPVAARLGGTNEVGHDDLKIRVRVTQPQLNGTTEAR
jgi:hypothetical protein